VCVCVCAYTYNMSSFALFSRLMLLVYVSGATMYVSGASELVQKYEY
jgi:hypothetical protein